MEVNRFLSLLNIKSIKLITNQKAFGKKKREEKKSQLHKQ